MDLSGKIENLSASKRQLLAQKLLSLDTDANKNQTTVKTQRLVAYVVADDLLPPTIDELKDLLKKSLPDYMVPQSFIFLDKIPLSPNGKVNLNALPEQDQERSSATTEFTAAANPVEEALVKIWSSVLGMEIIGIHDNFFEIGGDSILSIQIIARARSEGIHLTPKQIFQNLTISELASVAQTEEVNKAEQGLVTGDVPLTPIQHWLLERDLPNLNHWNQAGLFEIPVDMKLSLLEQAVAHLVTHHDVFRSRFVKKENVWQQEIIASIEPVTIQQFDLTNMSLSEANDNVTAISTELQAGLDVENNKVLSLCLFKMPGNAQADKLFIVAHHLVIDAVSWSTIMEDLQTAYTMLFKSEKVKLPAKTTSYKEWSNALIAYAETGEVKSEIDYWLSLPDSGVFDIPVDFENGTNNEKSEKKVTVTLSTKETHSLLKDIPSVYNTKIDDILLTALAQTVTQWTGCSTLSLGMEGHGREQINDDIDLSRSVGWFTSYFPVALQNKYKSPGDAITSIKEQLREIPNKGIGYAVLRYLQNDTDLTEKLTAVHQSNILYNYLGQFNSNDSDDMLFKMVDDTSRHHDLDGPRSHLIEIDAMITDNQLQLDWVYSENIHNIKTIETLAGNFIVELQKLIEHCQSPEAGGFSASDFPEADLAQDDLEDLLDMLDD